MDPMDIEVSDLVATLQLASPALPVGGFSYSAGLEAAHAHGLLPDAAAARHVIGAHLTEVFAYGEAPVWLLAHAAWQARDRAALERWNAWHLETRETREAREETLQMGWSMVRLAQGMLAGDATLRAWLVALEPVAYPIASAFAYEARQVGRRLGLAAYTFSWIENQCAAALRLIPLGQLQGQLLLQSLAQCVPDVLASAEAAALGAPQALVAYAPHLGILGARHETQYSRLFRS